MLGAHQRRQPLERGVHHRVHVLGIEVLAELGRADHVHEEDRDGLELLLALRSRAQGGELVAQRRDRHGDHRIAQHRALRF